MHGEGSRPDVEALTTTETYHWYAGSALRMLLLRPDGSVAEPVLGPGLDAGERPQVVVPAGTWQGSGPVGASSGVWPAGTHHSVI